MMEQIREIGMILAPKLFGKSYEQLLDLSGKPGELFQCAAHAQMIRAEARKVVSNQGGDPDRLSMSQFLEVCEQVSNRPKVIDRQKAELKKRGFLP
jgi:hypothetical protein